MKISFVLNFYPRKPVGGMKVVHEYANYLANRGHDISLYYLYSANNISDKYPLPDWVKLKIMKYRIEIKKLSWIDLHNKIKRIAIRDIVDSEINDADVIVATAVSTALPTAQLSIKKGKKVYLIQDFENWFDSDDYVCETYRQNMTNIVVAKWLKNIVDIYSKMPPVLISNCINTNIFKAINSNEKRIEHSIAFQYRSAAHKGCQYAIETIKILERQYSDLQVLVVSIDEQPKDLPRSCKFLQNITPEEVADVDNQVQVFMCSSIEEGFGLPGLEAMACGCALVSTEYRGVREYAVNNENALLSPVMNPQAMADNIILLFENKDLRHRITKAGLLTAKKRSLDITGEKFEQTLKDIL